MKIQTAKEIMYRPHSNNTISTVPTWENSEKTQGTVKSKAYQQFILFYERKYRYRACISVLRIGSGLLILYICNGHGSVTKRFLPDPHTLLHVIVCASKAVSQPTNR